MNANTTTHSFTSLKTRQQAFIKFLRDEGFTNTLIKREDLQMVAVKYGLGSPPAWIVRDTSRRSKRGYYESPELADLINNSPDSPDND
jgi:hypothetical protein